MSKLDGGRLVLARKVTGYLLNTAHPDGAAKATFFERFGFCADEPEGLIEALARHPDTNEVVTVATTPFGVKSVVQCSLSTRTIEIPASTVWVLETGSSIHRLVTAYPADV